MGRVKAMPIQITLPRLCVQLNNTQFLFHFKFRRSECDLFTALKYWENINIINKTVAKYIWARHYCNKGETSTRETSHSTNLLHVAGQYLKSRQTLSLSKNILISFWNPKVHTVFTKARYWTLSWASRIQFAQSIPNCIRLSLMLSSHLCLGLPSGLLPSGLPTKTL
jgi:formylmethanofuran dehydrogenase subunit E-like metal-binding protein